MLLARRNCNAAARSAAKRSTTSRNYLRVVSFKESDNVKDWRVKQMVDTCHVYYSNIWSRGELAAADALLDSKFVHRDLCSVANWGSPSAAVGAAAPVPATGMVVGPRAFKAMVETVRQQYPDLYVEVEQVAVSDTHRVFVSWISHGTQLEAPPAGTTNTAASPPAGPASSSHSPYPSTVAAPLLGAPHAAGPASVWGPGAAAGGGAVTAAPSYHNSLVRGVDIVTFNHDRSKILEVNAFRQLSSDEKRDVERRLAPNPLEIRLARLHWEHPEGGKRQ